MNDDTQQIGERCAQDAENRGTGRTHGSLDYVPNPGIAVLVRELHTSLPKPAGDSAQG